jgi:hypothetical protein
VIGIVGVFGSLVIFALSAVAGSFLGPATAGIGVVIGSFVMIFSLIWLLVGWGFASGKGWAWILGMIYTVISFVIAIGSLVINSGGGVLGILIWGLMLYYLTRPGVKTFFGKGGFPSAYPIVSGYAPAPPMYSIPPAGYQPPPASSKSPTAVPPGTTTQAIVLNPLAKEKSIPLAEATATSQSTSAGGTLLVSCPNCGSRLSMGSNKCSACGANI